MSQIICRNPKCLQQNRAGARFCGNCGVALAPSQPLVGTVPQTGQLATRFFLNERYIILEKIGQGGMGAVYKAEDVNTKQLVAIKEMSLSIVDDPEEQKEAIERFHQEAQLLQKLSHPNLPFVKENFSDGSRHYLVMEFINGSTLQDLLNQRGNGFSEQEVVSWSHQLCDVLDYLHAQQPPIIFRDLKPDNIMLSSTGQIKLIDFGIARLFKPGKQKDTVALGTLGFAPPEAFGREQSDPRSDIYAMGVTLCYLLTGKAPDATYPPYHSPKKLGAVVSRETDELIKKATSLKSEQRWSSMEEVKSVLLKIQPSSSPSGVAPNRPSPDQDSTTKTNNSRPTSRLILQTTKYSSQQLKVMALLLFLAFSAVLWVAVPILYQIQWFWNSFPSILIVAPFIFAATRHPTFTGIGHLLTIFVGQLIISMRTTIDMQFPTLFFGGVVSSLLLFGLFSYELKFLKTASQDDPTVWQKEIGWSSFCALITHFSLAASTNNYPHEFFSVPTIFFALLLGCLGWFLGDLIRSYYYFRQSGLTWRD